MSELPPEPFTGEEVGRMIAHMNEDHADSVLAYLRHFGGQPEATEARLIDLTSILMRVEGRQKNGTTCSAEIAFGHRLESVHDAHMTMVKMSKQAKRTLAGPLHQPKNPEESEK